MNQADILRLLILGEVLLIVLTVAADIVFPQAIPPTLRAYRGAAATGIEVLLGASGILILLASYVGLWQLRHWARVAYPVAVALTLASTTVIGEPAIYSRAEDLFDTLSAMCSGGILVMAWLSPLADRFISSAPANQHSHKDHSTIDAKHHAEWFKRLTDAFPKLGLRFAYSDTTSPAVIQVSRVMVLSVAVWITFLGFEKLYAQMGKLNPHVYVLLLGVPIYLVDRVFSRWVSRERRRIAARKVSMDNRQPIVLLRKFGGENFQLTRAYAYRFPVVGNSLSTEPLELALGNGMAKLGPVVAIGAPSDGSLVVGAIRVYAEDEDWQEIVRLLIREAQLIIVQLTSSIHALNSNLGIKSHEISSGVLRELQLLVEENVITKTAFLNIDLSGVPLDEKKFRAMTASMPPAIAMLIPDQAWKYLYVPLWADGLASLVECDDQEVAFERLEEDTQRLAEVRGKVVTSSHPTV